MKTTLQSVEILSVPLSFGKSTDAVAYMPIALKARSFSRRIIVGLQTLMTAVADEWRRADEIHRRLEERKRSTDYLRYGQYNR